VDRNDLTDDLTVEGVTVDDLTVDDPTTEDPAADDTTALDDPVDDPVVEPVDGARDGGAAVDGVSPVDDPATDPRAAAVAEPADDEAPEPAAEADRVDAEAADAGAADDVEAADAGAADDVEAGDVEAGDVVPTDVVDAETLLEEEAEEPEISPYDRPGRWYVVHTQSGYENKVRQNLEARTSSMNMEGRIHEVVIPTEDVVEFKGGRKVVVQRKVFPGYLLVRCELDDDSWYVIRNTPGVTGFVGQGNKPSPLPRRDVEAFLVVRKTGEAPTKRGKPRLEYELGETVRVKEGPFADFSGEIVDINEDQLKVKVLVNIFGRETPVELEFSQIARL
jgi:transcriptional antiterminator NusG